RAEQPAGERGYEAAEEPHGGSGEPGAPRRLPLRDPFDGHREDVVDVHAEELALGVARVEQLAIDPHRLDARDREARAVVSDVQGEGAAVGERLPSLPLLLRVGRL